MCKRANAIGLMETHAANLIISLETFDNHYRRLAKWENLSPTEQNWIRTPFPVLIGISDAINPAENVRALF